MNYPKRISTLAAVLLLCLACTGQTFAQGFSALIEKINTLESNLQRVEGQVKREVKLLRKELAKVKVSPAESTAGIQNALAALDGRMNQLAESLELVKQNSSTENDTEGVNELAGNLRHLIAELRATIAAPPEVNLTNDTNGHEPKSAEMIPGMTISGYVDASYFYDARALENSFGLDQVEVDIEKSIGSVGSIRADVEWVSDGAGGFTMEAEQGYLTFSPAFLGPVSFTFGKFNAPIGFELLDAPDMYQFSHALVFNYGLPTNLTGAMLAADLGNGFDMSLYLANGWDQNVDANSGKTIGSRLGYSLGERGGLGLSAITGSQEDSGRLSVFDFDLTLTPAEKWLFGGEFNLGFDTSSGRSDNWFGFLLMGHYDFTERVGFTTRYDFFNDQDGTRLGSGISEVRHAVTLAPTFALGAGMGALIELRLDFSGEDVFEKDSGDFAGSASALAFEMTYTF